MLHKKRTLKYTLLSSRNGRFNTPVSLCVSEPKPLPTVLTIFNAEGEKLFWSAPPEGAFFYYLTFNLAKEVVVVCSYAEKQNGWHEWFYSWDMKRNALSQLGPAY